MFKVQSLFVLPLAALLFAACGNTATEAKSSDSATATNGKTATDSTPAGPNNRYASMTPVDTAAYNKIINALANGDTSGKWPVKAPYPSAGAILPFHRVIAFYGNLFSTRMGILGELPKDSMIAKLKGEVANWQAADSSLPVIPALHYVAVTAQGAAGKDGKFRARMPFHQVDTIIKWAEEINALAFVDVQVGLSTVQSEIPQFEKYLSMPNVHLGIDPEFAMNRVGGKRPGSVIGSYDAEDINFVVDYLAGLVKKNNIPPKILVIHRFTNPMVRNYQNIKKVPEVQIVMDMDGWGDKILKKSSYLLYQKRDPVMFTGFKIFYKNDVKQGADQLYTPREVLALQPKPIYIQYQ